MEFDDPLPFGQSPVDYLGETTSDPVARLDGLLAAGKRTLRPVPGRGYLDSVLKSLGVPISSQLLVYSKTAVNQRLITPRTPRATTARCTTGSHRVCRLAARKTPRWSRSN